MPLGTSYAVIINTKNYPPVAMDDSYETIMGIPITITPLVNDFDPDSYPTGNIIIDTYESTTLNGSTVSANPTKTILNYTPKNGWFGNDIFTYKVTDDISPSNLASVRIAVKCLPPIIVDKFFNLKEKTTYSLDITNANSSTDIKFAGDLVDRDVNTPAQNISIVAGSVNASSNITINSVTDKVINFTTGSLGTGISVATTFLNYEIQNSICSIRNTGTASTTPGGGGGGGGAGGGGGGSINGTNVRIVQGFLGQTIRDSVPKSFTKYPMFDSDTNTYPFSAEGWFAFCFDTYSAPDQYYISMISKPYKDTSGNWTTDKYFHGLIGPIGDDLGSALNGNGRFIFWKPYGCDLNIWGKTDTSSSSYQLGANQLYNPDITDVKDPNRYFTDKLTRPTTQEVTKCLNDIGKAPFNNTVNDYTDTFTGTSVPSFISVI